MHEGVMLEAEATVRAWLKRGEKGGSSREEGKAKREGRVEGKSGLHFQEAGAKMMSEKVGEGKVREGLAKRYCAMARARQSEREGRGNEGLAYTSRR